jgi:hypothetical protein
MSEQKQKVLGVAAFESQVLAKRLKEAVEKDCYDVIPYTELSALIGFDVQEDGRGYLNTARQIVERDNERLFGIVRGVGVKLLDVPEQATVGPDAVKKMRKASCKTARRLARVQFDKMNNEQKHQYLTSASAVGAIAMFTSRKATNRIGEAVSTTMSKMTVDDTLKLFQAPSK